MRRRTVLGGLLASAGTGAAAAVLPEQEDYQRRGGLSATLTGKDALVLHSEAGLILETPAADLEPYITPAQRLFVLWHTRPVRSFNEAAYSVSVTGDVEEEVSFPLDHLMSELPSTSVVAVCQCTGNGRQFFDPPINDPASWANGGAGNGKWTGARVADLLARARPQPWAKWVVFSVGRFRRDGVANEYQKAMRLDDLLASDALLAYRLNDAPLPFLNGHPLRLVVPGWYGTYWVKAVQSIHVMADLPYLYWMDQAYRLPANRYATQRPGERGVPTVPVTTMLTRSFILSPAEGDRMTVGQSHRVFGRVIGSGVGIRFVEVSFDGGATWQPTDLQPSSDRFGWRLWSFDWTPAARGKVTIAARATDDTGFTQPDQQWNPAGYARCAIERVGCFVD